MNSVTTRVYSVDFFLAILGYSLFVIMDSIAKELTNYYHVTQIIFINSLSALLPILLYTQVRNSWKKIKTKNLKLFINNGKIFAADRLAGLPSCWAISPD